jgi:hypothetical protein
MFRAADHWNFFQKQKGFALRLKLQYSKLETGSAFRLAG